MLLDAARRSRREGVMWLEGEVAVRAPRDRVWRFLTDAAKVSGCAPGLETLEVVEDHRRFKAVASLGMGSVRARFVADAEWLDLEEPVRARMKVHATAPGSAADLTSEMGLQDGPDGSTAVHWSADVLVMGTIASIAARLMGSVSRRLVDAFFDRVRQRIEAEAASTLAEAAAVATAPAVPPPGAPQVAAEPAPAGAAAVDVEVGGLSSPAGDERRAARTPPEPGEGLEPPEPTEPRQDH